MKKKIKLIFFHPYSYLGGADNSLKRLIENLDDNSFSITFLSLNNSYLKKYFKKKIYFKKIKAKRTLFAVYELKKIIKSNLKNKNFKKIILISNQNFANIVSSFAINKDFRFKSIFIDRNHLDELNFYNNFKERIKKIIIKILVKFRYRKADIVIGISKKLSNDLSKHIGCPVKTIYSPSFDKGIIKKSKERVKLDKKFKYIINVSRFSKRKDVLTSLKAFKIVLNEIKNVKLILVGYGPELNKIKLSIKNMKLQNNVIIINKTYNPYKYIKHSKLLILTSIYEGFPNVITESLTIGTPVISTNSNAGASEILLNGKGGDLITIGDYKKLSQKIITHLRDKKALINKMKLARKKLYRFETKRHGQIYNKLFNQI